MLRLLLRPDRALQLVLAGWLGIPPSKWIVNALFQRVFRINGDVAFQVNFTSIVLPGKGITLGRNVWKSFALSGNCYVQGGNGVFVGDETVFAPGVKIISANHDPEGGMEWIETEPVRIGRNCWIGANAVILPGVELGDHTVVGAGAVVARSFPAGNCVLVGVPAQILPKLQPNAVEGGTRRRYRHGRSIGVSECSVK